MKVKELLVGQYGLTQAVLVPETSLTVGWEYTLVIDKLPKDESINRWNSKLLKNEPIVYKVVDDLDIINPTFKITPKEIKKSLDYYGCGTAMHVYFECFVSEGSEYLIRSTVKNLTTGNETSYYLEPEHGTLKIGYGMCSGAFDLAEGDEYEIELSIVDASGNATAWAGDGIKFAKPTDVNTNLIDK